MAEKQQALDLENLKSKHGLAFDEVYSALQKSIRRSNTEYAIRIGYEIYESGEVYEEFMWKRLMVISVEDVGLAEPSAANLVYTLYRMHENYEYDACDRALFFIHAIRYLCSCKKDRSSDICKNIVLHELKQGITPEIPDYALDMHTRRGREAGRDVMHFLLEASKVTPEADTMQESYKRQLIEIIQKENQGV